MGYIANEGFFFSASEIEANKPDVKNAPFHCQFCITLESYYQAQEPNALFDIPLCLGNKSKRVNLYVPLQFIIGDVEGGDTLCSRFNFYGQGCMQLCWTCDVSQANAGRTDIVCSRVQVADIQHFLATGSKEEIKSFAQRPGFDSLYQIDCGGNTCAIFSMRIHTEGLHAIEVGFCAST
jgi:hypothetical protein